MIYNDIVHKLNESTSNVSEIDLERISADEREYDTNFKDKLENLGYEYMLKLDGRVFYKEISDDEDFIVIDLNEGIMFKVDHNGENLFFDASEVEALEYKEGE